MLYGPIFSSKTEVISNDIQKNSLKNISFSKGAKPKTSGYGRKMLHCELGNVIVILFCMKTQKTMQIPQICN